MIIDEDQDCDTLVMKHHTNTGTCQRLDPNSDKSVFNNLKFLTKNMNLA